MNETNRRSSMVRLTTVSGNVIRAFPLCIVHCIAVFWRAAYRQFLIRFLIVNFSTLMTLTSYVGKRGKPRNKTNY